MKQRLTYILLIAVTILSGCKLPQSSQGVPSLLPSSTTTLLSLVPRTETIVTTLTVTHTSFLPIIASNRLLPQQVRWQIQYTGELQIDLEVDVFNLDLFDAPSEVIKALHQRNIFVMCYFSAGSYEEWRPDAHLFPQEVLGEDLQGWPGERWLDIRRLDLLSPIMEARLDLAVSKGCDGVDPDNVDSYIHDTGFPLTADAQKRYNIFLAEAAHRRGLMVGLKNDLEQIPQLVSYFDWALNEECFYYGECERLLPFVQSGKPVFVIEYELEPSDFCPQALQMNFNALHKKWELDSYRVDCQEWSAKP